MCPRPERAPATVAPAGAEDGPVTNEAMAGLLCDALLEWRRSGETHPWLARIPRELRAAVIARGLLGGLVRDIRQSRTPAAVRRVGSRA